MTSSPDGFDTVLVVDFGAQYAQLIARRVRECRVFSEIVPSTMPLADMLAKRPKAIILSGGPSSVYADGAPQVDAALFETGVPTFGICYGFQAMARALGQPEYPFAVIPHPISNNSDAVLREKAEDAARQCVALLLDREDALALNNGAASAIR